MKLLIIYRNLNENCLLIVEKLIKWKEVFPLLELQEFVKCVRCIPRMTISMKLRSFQYRLLMNVVITNVHLKVLKLRSNNLCSFCDVETESLTHLFHNYQLVTPLWDMIKNLLDLNDITLEQIIFNNINQNFKAVDNCIVLIMKYYIYRTRCLNEKLNVQVCKKFIKDFHDIEEYQAPLHDKLNLHITKWSHIDLK